MKLKNMYKIRFFYKVKSTKKFVSINLETKKNFIKLLCYKRDIEYLSNNNFKDKIVFGKKNIRMYIKEVIRNINTNEIKNISAFIFKKKKTYLFINYLNIGDSPIVKKNKMNIYINVRKIKILLLKKLDSLFINLDLKKVKKRIKIEDIVLPSGCILLDNKKKFLISTNIKK